MTLQPTRRPSRLVLAFTTVLALGACASEDDGAATDPSPSAEASSEEFPVTVDAANGEVTIEERPERIVSLSPSATEILFAIGAGDQVEAVDAFSNYPEEAPTTDLSGYEPNVEAIAGYEPDLVVAANDANDMVGSLEELGIPVVVNAAPSTVDGGYEGMEVLGTATGHTEETADVVEQMRSEVEAALDRAPDASVRVYHELDENFYAASSYGFIGSIYEEMGAENIADAADTDQNGYPQLTEEAIIEADPELVVITDQVSYTADDVAARPGWADVSAVQDDAVVTVDADVSSRWGPRLPDLISTLAEAMDSAASSQTG
jgi:iron complex transport system substrate-binding protein